MVSALQLRPLTITLEDAAAVESLPAHHNDPFDRLLIAQAKLRGLDLVSADEVFDSYGIRRIW